MAKYKLIGTRLINGDSYVKSNAGDQKVHRIKSLSWLFSEDRKIQPMGSLFGITRQSLVMPNQTVTTLRRIFYPLLKHMKDSYNTIPYRDCKNLIQNICLYIQALTHLVLNKCLTLLTTFNMSLVTRKPVFGVSDQVRLKAACSATENSYSLEILDLASIGIILSK